MEYFILIAYVVSIFGVVFYLFLVKTKFGKAHKGFFKAVYSLSSGLLGFVIVFHYFVFTSEKPKDGIHRIDYIILPTYRDDKMVINFEDSSHSLEVELGSIENFNHCCYQQSLECGCLELCSDYFTFKTTVRVVPCPDKFLPITIDCSGHKEKAERPPAEK